MSPSQEQTSSSTPRRRVLVTGAAGHIGVYFVTHSHHLYDLVLSDRPGARDMAAIADLGEVREGDIADLEAMKTVCRDVDTVVHLAGSASPATPWEPLLQNNIIGTYNVFTAAKVAGCRRVIYASSIHAVSGYAPEVQVKTGDQVNPADLYGVSKCFGEALGRYMAEQEGLSVIALRIGAFLSREGLMMKSSRGWRDAWVAQPDLVQLIQKCIDTEEVHFAIFHALSDNHFKRLDISDARKMVDYAPQDGSTGMEPWITEKTGEGDAARAI